MGDISAADAQSALGWWIEAGVDTIVDEAPRDWMKRAAPPVPPPTREAADAMPHDLPAFAEWLATADLPTGGAARVAARGDPAAGLMVIADMPDGGAALGGDAATLFDRMLAAIGRDRASIYLALLSPAQLPAARLPEAAIAALAPIALRHVALAAPRMLLLLGDAPSQALLGMPMAAARGRLHKINLEGATVSTVATFHPRFLLQRPTCKADAWTDLRLMLGGMSL